MKLPGTLKKHLRRFHAEPGQSLPQVTPPLKATGCRRIQDGRVWTDLGYEILPHSRGWRVRCTVNGGKYHVAYFPTGSLRDAEAYGLEWLAIGPTSDV